jgi:hypothetical protein
MNKIMDCHSAQECLLDSFVEAIPDDRRLVMENHIATCEVCGPFALAQQVLETRLAAAVSSESLSPGFRRSLKERICRNSESIWSDSLPDLAHLVGCALAIALLLVLLPQYSRMLAVVGSGFTAVTYFLQAVLRTSLEASEQRV